MTLDKQQLAKTIIQTHQNQLLALSVSPHDKDSTKVAITALQKFLARTGDYTIIAVRK
jgi:hypothetical protein